MAQKTLLQLIQAAAGELNVTVPTVVYASTDPNVVQLLTLTRSVLDDLLLEYDWQVLQTRYSFTTTTGIDNYALPSDIERFINCTMFDATNRWQLRGPKSPVEWEMLKVQLVNGGPYTRFRVYGGKFWITPAPSAPVNINFEYISNACVYDISSSSNVPDFTSDIDVCLFDHKVVVKGIKLKWKQAKGQDTTAAQQEYDRALDFTTGQDRPGQPLSLLGNRAGSIYLGPSNYPDGGFG